jgi:hypothetical protein
MARKPKSSASPAEASDGAPNRTAGARAPKRRPLTDEDRHKRFKDMAREVEASEDEKDFDKAFESVTRPIPPVEPTDAL